MPKSKRIDLSRIKVERDTFAEQIRKVIQRCEDQTFTARQIIAYMMRYNKLAKVKGLDNTRRQVREVIKKLKSDGDIEFLYHVGNYNAGVYKNNS